MQSLFGSMVAITIVLNQINTVKGIEPMKLLIRELNDDELKVMNTTVHSGYYKERQRAIEESIGTANIILIDDRYVKLLPTTEKSEVVVQVSYGDNGRTGLLTLYFLQVILKKLDMQAYTRVVVFICREQNTETGEEDVETGMPIPLADRIKEFEKIFEALKSEFPRNGFVLLQQEFGKTQLNNVLNKIHPNLTCANWDCKMGSGKIGKNIHQKMFLSTVLDNFLHYWGIPLFGNDLRSGQGALNSDEWLTPTYCLVSTARVHPEQYPQGLVVTKRTNEALTELQSTEDSATSIQSFKKNPRNGSVVTVAYVFQCDSRFYISELTSVSDVSGYLHSTLRAFKVEFFNFVNGSSKVFQPLIQNEIQHAIYKTRYL